MKTMTELWKAGLLGFGTAVVAYLLQFTIKSGGAVWFTFCTVMVAPGMLAQVPFRRFETPLLNIVLGLFINAAVYTLFWRFIIALHRRRSRSI
jgi:hypothetical protein